MALDRLSNITRSGLGSVYTYDVGGIISTGVITATSFSGSGNFTAVDGTFSGNVSIGGTLTYEDVTNIDSVGLITARSGIHVTGGSVGIGTNNPQAPFGGRALHLGNISDTRSVLTLQSSTTGRNSIYFSDGITGGDTYRGYIDYIHNDNAMTFGVETSERLRITTSGNVGIGTTNPTESKIVIGHTQTSTVKHLAIKDLTNNWVRKLGVDSSNNFGIFSGDTEHLRITGIGSVGIGNNNPEVLLHLKETNADPYNTVITHLKLQNDGGNGGSGNRIEFQTGIARCWIQSFIDGPNSNSGGALVFGTPSTGTLGTERMRIDSAGRITTPAQPAFCVSNQSGAQPSSNHNVPSFNSTFFNVGNHWDSSNKRFTAPVDGMYLFTGHIIPTGLPQNSSFELWISVNSSTVSTARRFLDRQKKTETDSNTFSVGGSVTIQLSANDWVQLQTSTATYSDETNCKFSGFLVG